MKFKNNNSRLFFYILLFLIHTVFISCDRKRDPWVNENWYYVSVNGDDNNDGTIERPFRTIQRGVDAVEPGRMLLIMEGRYEEKVFIRNSGTHNKRIVIAAFPGHEVILDGTNIDLKVPEQALIRLENVHYVSISGLIIENSKSCGIYGKNGSSNIDVEYCIIRNCIAPGICFGADFIATRNIKVIGNYVERCATLSREAISLRTVDNFEIALNTVKNVIKESIDVKSGCKNGSIHHNYIVNAGLSAAIYLDAGYFDKPVNDGQYNIHVHSNIIENPNTSGIAVVSEMGNNTRDIYIYNNLIYDLRKGQGAGIKVADHTDEASTRRGFIENVFIYNNTVYGRAQQGIYVNTPGIRNIVICNNISANNWLQIKLKDDIGIDRNEVRIENNLCYGTAQNGDFGIHVIKEDPQFVDVEKGNFYLRPNSPAIDRGMSEGAPSLDFAGTSRPQGNGYDLGAYEFIFSR